jgi:GDSL-like Lipase/Acylhydrolase
MRTPRFARLAASLILLALIAAPVFAAARGTADFTRFAVIGDSYGAGFTNLSLNANHQQFSWPATIARQAGAGDFQQPLVSPPGIPNELQLSDIVKFPPVIGPTPGTGGAPTNLTLARPYNNLSIPGATVNDVITLTGKQAPTGTSKLFAQFILRGLGTEVDQALALNPTFIAVWIGGNDALGAVLDGTPKSLTSKDNFTRDYNAMLDKLTAGAPNAGIVVGTLPTHVAVAPIASTLAPVVINPATRQPVPGPDGKPIFLIAELGDGTVGQLPPGSMVLLTAATDLSSGFGIPAALASAIPLPNVGKPLPDADVLTPAEIAAIETRIGEFNSVITAAAAARNIPVADITGYFNQVQTGISLGGVTLTDAFLTGGLFGYDGFHMTDIGYTLFADVYIRTINAAYGSKIPLAPISSFFANNAPRSESGMVPYPGMEYEISQGTVDAMRDFAKTEQVAPARRRGAVH